MAISAAADTSDTAVALAELPAAKVSFQRLIPRQSPTQNDDSADVPVFPAVQFSGSNAKSAIVLHFAHLET
jgi:hypothetical protein